MSIKSEPLSNVDAAWLHMDAPTNLANITGVMTFDRPIDFDRLVTTIENRLLTYKRFRQRVREPRFGVGNPRWEYDRHFDIRSHLHRVALPAPADHNALQQFVSDVMTHPLDRSKPLWHYYYVDNYCTGSALVAMIHHCVADGVALMQVLLSMTDSDPDAPIPTPPEWEDTRSSLLARLIRPAIGATRMVRKTVETTQNLAHEGMETLIRPARWLELTKLGADSTKALAKLVLIPPDKKTIFKGQCGVGKQAAWSVALKLEDVKAVGQAMGGTINDVLLSAVTGGLRRYLEENEQPVSGLNIRAIVPVNLRPTEEDYSELGNRFGLVFLSLPIGVRDQLKRLVILKRRMNDIKNSPEAVVAINILGAIGMTPKQIEDIIVTIFGIKATAVMTNVPGPRQKLYLAGSELDSLMFWVPSPANLGMGVSILSYAGKIILGVATDKCLVPDPERIIEHFHDEFEQMKTWGRLLAEEFPLEEDAQNPEEVAEACTLTPIQIETNPNGCCQAMTRSGNPCKNQALTGETTCRVHRKMVSETVE